MCPCLVFREIQRPFTTMRLESIVESKILASMVTLIMRRDQKYHRYQIKFRSEHYLDIYCWNHNVYVYT